MVSSTAVGASCGARGRMGRQVRGSLFLDYVRMLKVRKDVDFRRHLAPEDLPYLSQQVDPAGWYPMATFERFGLAILKLIADGDLEAVRVWGHISVGGLVARYPDVLVKNDPRESLMRFQVVRRTFFDFEAATIARLHDREVRVEISYQMSPAAEEAASYQTMGFFEGLVELAGGRDVTARFDQRAWCGANATTLVVSWKPRDCSSLVDPVRE
jgi:hypothetical protein